MRIEENDTQLIAHFPHDPQTGRLVLGIVISFVLFGLEALKSMRSGFGWLSALWVGLFFLFAWIIWRPLYSSRNGRIVFDRKDMFVHAFYPAFWSLRESCYSMPLKEFDGVQSYILQRPRITSDRWDIDWDMNVLELVTKEPMRGKIVHRLSPWIKEGASKAEEENPEIACLAQKVSCFLGIQNYGFLGNNKEPLNGIGTQKLPALLRECSFENGAEMSAVFSCVFMHAHALGGVVFFLGLRGLPASSRSNAQLGSRRKSLAAMPICQGMTR